MGATLKLEVGDVVRLRSGGPQMTIETVSGLIGCTWFAGNHSKRNFFEPDTLVLVPKAEDYVAPYTAPLATDPKLLSVSCRPASRRRG